MLLIRQGRMPAALVTDARGVSTPKTLDYVDLLSALDHSAVVTELKKDPVREHEIPDLPAGALLLSMTERPSGNSFVVTGAAPPATHLFVVEGGGETTTHEVPLPHVAYRAEWESATRSVRRLSLALCSPENEAAPDRGHGDLPLPLQQRLRLLRGRPGGGLLAHPGLHRDDPGADTGADRRRVLLRPERRGALHQGPLEERALLGLPRVPRGRRGARRTGARLARTLLHDRKRPPRPGKERELTEKSNQTNDNAGAKTEHGGGTPAPAPASAPAGTTTPGALFDMAPEKAPTKPGSGKGGQGASTKAAPRTEPQKYPEGTEVRYGRETVHLPKEMSAKEVLDWMSEDDYPELKYEDTELRHDKEKNRLVVVRKAQKKGARQGGRRGGRASGRSRRDPRPGRAPQARATAPSRPSSGCSAPTASTR